MDHKTKLQQDIIDSVPEIPHGILLLSPRIGKTRIAIEVIKKSGIKRVLWVTPNIPLRDVEIPAEFVKWKAKTILNRSKIICWSTLSRIKGHYDLIILDEYQYMTEENTKNLLTKELSYNAILCLSGTAPKGEDKIEIVKALELPILSEMTITEAVEEGVIADYDIEVILTKLDDKDKKLAAGSKDKPFMQTEAGKYKYLTKRISSIMFSGKAVPSHLYIQRMHFIKNLESKRNFTQGFLEKLKGRTLIFASNIEQAELLSKHTHHSKKKSSDLPKFLRGEIDRLACVNSGGIGSTYRDVDNFVITQVNSNKNGDTTQKIARSLVPQEGYKAKIYLIVADDTVDVNWAEKALEDFDSSKVKWISSKSYE